MATDAAGNSALVPLSYSWTIALKEGLPYARNQDSPFVLTGNPHPAFSFQVRDGEKQPNVCM